MKLRQKTWLIVGTALVSLPAICFGAAAILLLRGFSTLETKIITQHVNRVLDALANDLASLNRTALDWASWDETYNFAANQNSSYLTANLPEDGSSLIALRLNLMAFLDRQGQVLFAQSVDLETQTPLPISANFLAQLTPYRQWLNLTELDDNIVGFLPVEAGYLLVVARPILTSYDEGPVRGTLVMGRLLNPSEVEHLESLTQQPQITLESVDPSQLSADFPVIQQPFPSLKQPVFIQRQNRKEIEGYTLINDIAGQPLLRLRVTHPRNIYAQGLTSLGYLFLATLTTAAIFGVITITLLERGVLSRLKKLSQKVSQIGVAHDFSTRIQLTGQDELTDLAQTINWTLDQLEEVQQSLQQTSAKLAASNAELEQFAYAASHDLQAPLRKIEAFSNLLQTTCSSALDEAGKSYLQRIHRSTQQMRELIQALLDLARISNPVQPMATVDLTKILNEVVEELAPQIHQLGAEVTIDSLPAIEAEPHQMRQLFQNLIGNALKFHPAHAVPRVTVNAQWPQASLSAADSAQEPVCQIAVADNGIGFDEKHQERIFKIFQRLHTREEYEGTGIGLAICTKIVQRHHGLISASSQPGYGSTFKVTLPLKQPV
ncbi:sensor histidine kinase [Almyronema epifaneia]|uniref:histidine kinase n=1 Tax=Almyronema epifaneia S1 TaxID=2991925 RepID=A0ABW6IES0_9CYAN